MVEEVESDRDRGVGTEEEAKEGNKEARTDSSKSMDRNDIRTAHKKRIKERERE